MRPTTALMAALIVLAAAPAEAPASNLVFRRLALDPAGRHLRHPSLAAAAACSPPPPTPLSPPTSTTRSSGRV